MRAKFMTGVYGTFDPMKLCRETRPGFHGVEVSCLRDFPEATRAARYARDHGLAVGVHFPLVREAYQDVVLHPWLTSTEERIRKAGFDAVARDLEAARLMEAEYLVLHYPKPAIVDSSLDWSDWRFTQDGEAIDARSTSRSEQEDLSFAAFDRLSRMARESPVRLVIEHDILDAMHYEPMDDKALLPRLLDQFPNLGLCADTGRLHLMEVTAPRFDALRFTSLMLPYITNIHLWTVQAGTNRLGGHHPVLPSLRKADGWGDMAGLLRVLSLLPDAYMLFEHNADLLADGQLDECYSWAASALLGSVSGK